MGKGMTKTMMMKWALESEGPGVEFDSDLFGGMMILHVMMHKL